MHRGTPDPSLGAHWDRELGARSRSGSHAGCQRPRRSRRLPAGRQDACRYASGTFSGRKNIKPACCHVEKHTVLRASPTDLLGRPELVASQEPDQFRGHAFIHQHSHWRALPKVSSCDSGSTATAASLLTVGKQSKNSSSEQSCQNAHISARLRRGGPPMLAAGFARRQGPVERGGSRPQNGADATGRVPLDTAWP